MQLIKQIVTPSVWNLHLLGVLIFITSLQFSFGAPSISHAAWLVELPQKDRQAILNLLRTTQFSKLDQHYVDLQQQYETGLINDRDLTLQYQAFYDTSPETEAFLNQWVNENPKSYPARLARGIYYASVGEAHRGSDVVRNTPSAKLLELHRFLDMSNRDIVDSLPLTKRPIVSVLQLLKSSKHRDGKQANRMWVEYANRIDPKNYGPRRQYMISLTPRWGGSYDEMWLFLRECQAQQIPREYLKVLESRIYLDQAQMEQHQPEKGLVLYRKVVTLLDGIDVQDKLDALKGIVDNRKSSQSLIEFLPEIEAILYIMPTNLRALSYRAWIRFQQGRFEEGLRDYATAAELGDAYSQLQLGKQLYYGIPPTVPPNPEQARYWIGKSADQGDEAARKFLIQIEPKGN